MSVDKIWRVLTNSGNPYPAALAYTVACLPIACAAWLIYCSSANAPTNDFAELVPRIGKMLEPGYDWTRLARDSSMSSHCLLIPMLMHLLNIWLFKWNVTLELYGGLVLCLIKVILIDRMINLDQKIGPGHRTIINALILVAISGLSFGAANVSVMLYNLTAVAYGITFFSFIAGLYALYRFENSRKGLLLMLLAGFATSFSNGGSAMFSWMSYGLYIALQPTKNRRAGLLTCVTCFIVSLASISYLVHSGGIESATIRPHLPDIRMFLQCFALPFLKQTVAPVAFTSSGIAIGLVGWLMAAMLLFLTIRRRLWTKPIGICLSLAAFATMNIFAATAFRTIVAPWYDSFAALFWMAILGLAHSLAAQRQADDTESLSPPDKGLRLAIALVPLCSIYVMFFCSNLSYRDKDSFRDSHCPATESAMRNFDTCPTYGEANLFSFSIGQYRRIQALCQPLARRGLACFGSRKQLLLQGDYLLPRVRSHLYAKDSAVYWIKGQSARRHHQWNEPEHLNLALGGDASVIWPVDLPSLTTEAMFRTKFALAQSKRREEKQQPVPSPLAGEILIMDGETSERLFYRRFEADANGHWQPLEADLREYTVPGKGRSLEIKLSVHAPPSTSPATLVFESPRIDLNQDPTTDLLPDSQVVLKPANTELSPQFRWPREDDCLWPLNADSWDLYGLDRISPSSTSKTYTFKATKVLSSVTYKPALSIPVNSVDRFYIEISVPENIRPRAVCCQMVINGAYLRQIFIPLLDDGKLHRYTYDLKLCNFSSSDEIRGFKVLPIFTVEPGAGCNIGIGKMGFLKP